MKDFAGPKEKKRTAIIENALFVKTSLKQNSCKKIRVPETVWIIIEVEKINGTSSLLSQ